MDTRPRPGPPMPRGWIRLRSRPGTGKQMRPIVQCWRWWRILRLRWPPTFWTDWFPAENAVRSLEHEFIECVERAAQILEYDLPDAEAWLESCYEKLSVTGDSDGITPAWYEELRPRESEMPNVHGRFEKLKKLFPKGRIDAQRPEGGSRTLYYLEEGRLDNTYLFRREDLGATFTDIIRFKIPSVFNRKPQGNQNQGGKGNQQKKPPEYSWED